MLHSNIILYVYYLRRGFGAEAPKPRRRMEVPRSPAELLRSAGKLSGAAQRLVQEGTVHQPACVRQLFL